MYLSTHWHPIYWNTACLIVNSGSLENENENNNDIDEDEEIDIQEAKEKGTDYNKLAKALSKILANNIKVSLVDINESEYSFSPDIKNNVIRFGLKALSNINMATIKIIIEGRPYKSIKDFMNRCPLDKRAMIPLIKGGAFDELVVDDAKKTGISPRVWNMIYYLYTTSNLKQKLTLQNFNELINRNLLPLELENQKKLFIFNKILKQSKFKEYYSLPDNIINQQIPEIMDNISLIDNHYFIEQKYWDKKIYSVYMDKAREWLKNNQEKVLKQINYLIFKENWDKYGTGNLSSWEMDSLGFYYHEHELKNVNSQKYGLKNFSQLSEEPDIDYVFKKGSISIPIYKLYKIVGTIIGKDNAHSSIYLLTNDGVPITVKFTKEYYANYNKQISEVQADGKKKIMEKGWFTRGTKIMCTGFRRGDTFVAKTYKNTLTHQLYKITNITSDGNIDLVHERYGA